MPEEELIDFDDISDIHDAVVVGGMDRYSDISEPESPPATTHLDALAAAAAAVAEVATATSAHSDSDASFVIIPETPRGPTPVLDKLSDVAC